MATAEQVDEQEQLEWEERAGKPAGYASIFAAVMLLLGGLVAPTIMVEERPPPSLDSQRLLEWDRDPAALVVPTALEILAYLALPLVLLYLYKATKARRPQLLGAVRYLAVGGPLLVALGYLVLQVTNLGLAADFAKENLFPETRPTEGGLGSSLWPVIEAEDRADDLASENSLVLVFGSIQFAALMAFVFSIVLLSLNAMRAGLLSRFLGILGVVGGVLTVLGFLGPIVIVYWLAALGVLFLGRWPNGRGPAWDVVEEVPWPTAMDKAAARDAEDKPARGSSNGAVALDEYEYDDEDADGDELDQDDTEARPHPASAKKRKRKRRR